MEQRSETGIKALEYLFQHPCFWNFQTIGSFYQTTDKFLKDTKRKEWDAKQNGNNRIAGKSIRKFIEQMNNTALKTNVFGSCNTGWKTVLDNHDTSHYAYLATSYYANGTSEELEYDEKLITQLLTILRHKWEHLRHVPHHIKIILKWVIKDNDAPEGQLSVQYFTTLFPDVLPFLWKQFFEHRKTPELRPFYAGLMEDQRMEDFPGNINDLLAMIGNTLDEDLKNGNVNSYFETELSDFILECRSVSLASINNMLSNSSSSSMLIEIGTNQMNIWWQGSSPEPMKYVCEQTKLANCSIVISNNFTKIDNGLLDKCKNSKKVIALVSDESKIEAIRELFEKVLDKQLFEHELEWKDLEKLDSDFAQKLLESTIQVQGVGMPLSSILPKNSQNRSNVLSGLKGSLLCKFLSSQTMSMFDKPNQPVINTPYIERTLTPRISVDPKVLNRVKESESDIVIVSGVTFQKLKALVGKEIKILKTSEINFHENQKCRIFYTKLSYDCYEDMLEGDGKIAKWYLTRKHVHCLKFENQKLVWLGTNECPTLPDPILKDLNFKDNNWLRNASLENLPRVTCLSNKLGMGKSTILGKFAKVLKETFPSFIVVLIDIEDFKTKIVNLPLTKQNVLNVLLQLICKSEFETKVAKYWLGFRGIQNTLNFQIMFDGLNEFSEEAQHLVVEATKVINTSLPSVRVLITTQDITVINALCNIEQVAILHLKPFSRSDSIRYLTESWIAAASAGGRNVSDEITKNIELLAEDCVDANILRESVDLAGTPLLCYMLAKIFEDIALAGHAKCELDSWVNITSVKFFETLFMKLAQAYINKKFQCSIKDNDSMVNIIHQDMMKKHTYFAVKYLISENAANEFKNRLAFTDIESSLKDISEFGIIKSVEPLQFVSKIFPGFLVASFFIQVINGTHGTAFSIRDTWFRDAMWKNALKVQDPRLSLGYVNCKSSTIAYFMDAYISQSSSQHFFINDSKVLIDKHNDTMTFKANMFLNLFQEEIQVSKSLKLNNLFDVTLTAKFPLRHLFCFAIGCGQTVFCERAFIANGPLRHEIFRKKPCSLIEFIVRTVTGQYDNEYVKYTPTKDIKILLPHLKKLGFPGLTNIKCGKALWKLIVRGDVRKKDVREWIRFIVEQLGADVNNIVDVHDSTLLHVVMRKAIKANTTREFKLYCKLWNYLLDKGAKVRENVWGMTAFTEALQMFRNENRLFFIDELQYYSSFIRDKQFSDSTGDNILMITVQNKNSSSSVIRKLIDAGVDVNHKNVYGRASVHLAVYSGRIDIYRILIEAHADIEIQDIVGRCVIQYSFYSKSQEMIDYVRETFPDKYKYKTISENMDESDLEAHELWNKYINS